MVVSTDAAIDTATVGGTDAAVVAATAVSTDAATAEPLVLVKRQAPAAEATGCILYRYGTFSTQLDIVRECGTGGSRWGPERGGPRPS